MRKLQRRLYKPELVQLPLKIHLAGCCWCSLTVLNKHVAEKTVGVVGQFGSKKDSHSHQTGNFLNLIIIRAAAQAKKLINI